MLASEKIKFELQEKERSSWRSWRLQTLAQVFPCEFCEIFKNAFFKEHFWTTAFEEKRHYIVLPPKKYYHDSSVICNVILMWLNTVSMQYFKKMWENIPDYVENAITSYLINLINFLSNGWITYRFSYALRHNDAKNMTPAYALLFASFPDFRQNR